MKQRDKIYLMAVAATGKSYFATTHANYRGFRVVDFAATLPKPNLLVKILQYLGRRDLRFARLTRNSDFVQAKLKHNYHQAIIQYLRDQDTPTAVLGRPGPEDISGLSDITLGAVLLPWPKHRENCGARRSELRNPLRTFDHRSTRETEILRLRGLLEEYAHERNIPIFESFEQALDVLTGSGSQAPQSVRREMPKPLNPQLCTESTDG